MTPNEDYFHLNNYINKQNCRYWTHGNQRELHQQSLSNEKVTVGVHRQVGIIGPYFFENEKEIVMINSECFI